jgi:hypothetical protein
MRDSYHVLNLGAGIQSTYILLHLDRQSPGWEFSTYPVTHAIMADTGEEPIAVYRHVEWLQSVVKRIPIIIVSKGKLGDDLVNGVNSTGHRFASIPAYTAPAPEDRGPGWQEGMTRRQCTSEYKIEPLNKGVRERIVGLKYRQPMPKWLEIHNYIGISMDEARRAVKQRQKYNGHPNYHVHFPLIEKGLTRVDCERSLLSDFDIPHQVPRSACVFCPYKTDAEWERLRTSPDPEDWSRAVEVDAALRLPKSLVRKGMTHYSYLHRSCQPLTQITFNPNPRELSPLTKSECEGMCGN